MKKLLPIIAWLVFLGLTRESVVQSNREGALVIFAVLVLVPACLELLDGALPWWYWVPAAGLYLGYCVFPHPLAATLAFPYYLLAAWRSVWAFANLLVSKKFELKNWVRVAALVYWATGAGWALFFLDGIRPFGFDEEIVGLTAAHFHIAGFVLAVVVYCLLSEMPVAMTRVVGWGILAGMPAVATGITLTKLGYSPAFEWVSALGFVALVMGIVWQQMNLVFQKKYPSSARLYWLGGLACLLAGGVLAGLYALRFIWPIAWVNIPNMKVWHGTLNAVGFGWLMLRGWWLFAKSEQQEKPAPGHFQRPSAWKM